MINNKGKAHSEILIVLVVILLLTSILSVFLLKCIKTENFRAIKSDFILMINNNNIYNLKSNDEIVSLKELVDQGAVENIKNPFNHKQYCDIYESRVEVKNNRKIGILKCGDYLITNENEDNKSIVYKVSKWQDKKSENSEVKVGYNYIQDNKLVFNTYYYDYMFLYLFNRKNNTTYNNVNTIPEKNQVITQVFYRTKEKIKEI